MSGERATGSSIDPHEGTAIVLFKGEEAPVSRGVVNTTVPGLRNAHGRAIVGVSGTAESSPSFLAFPGGAPDGDSSAAPPYCPLFLRRTSSRGWRDGGR